MAQPGAAPPHGGDPGAAVEAAHRDHWARLVAILATELRRLDVAEDALQDAFAAAARRWPDPAHGVPANPPAWLLTAARRRAVDRLRSEAAAGRRLPRIAAAAADRAVGEGLAGGPPAAAGAAAGAVEEAVLTRLEEDEGAIPDERLQLIFACCHPALAPEARVALTLRFVAGLRVPEIARLLLVQPSTMAARLTRAKKKVAAAGIPLAVPCADELEDRLAVVRSVLYLLFTEGYAATAGPDLHRPDLAAEAIRLIRLLDRLLPGRPPTRALLALALLQHARRDARVDAAGRPVRLADQDLRRWDRGMAAEGVAAVAALDGAPPEPYLLQARIAAAHTRAPEAGGTDWPAIAGWYAQLEALTGSPVVRLNRAVAVAEVDGPLEGLRLLEGLDDVLPHLHRLPAVRAELLARAGRVPEARRAFDRALALVGTDVERAHLRARRDSLS